jgi:hypothetical protein
MTIPFLRFTFLQLNLGGVGASSAAFWVALGFLLLFWRLTAILERYGGVILWLLEKKGVGKRCCFGGSHSLQRLRKDNVIAGNGRAGLY